MEIVPPLRFGAVEEGLYRGAYPLLRNFNHLRRLKLKTIISLIPEEPTKDLKAFCKAEGIANTWVEADRFKGEPQLLHADLSTVLSVLLNNENYPIYIHCLDGRQTTGMCIMALRKVMCWDYQSQYDEFLRYAKEAGNELAFIVDYPADLQAPAKLPRWLWPSFENGVTPSTALPPFPSEKLVQQLSSTPPPPPMPNNSADAVGDNNNKNNHANRRPLSATASCLVQAPTQYYPPPLDYLIVDQATRARKHPLLRITFPTQSREQHLNLHQPQPNNKPQQQPSSDAALAKDKGGANDGSGKGDKNKAALGAGVSSGASDGGASSSTAAGGGSNGATPSRGGSPLNMGASSADGAVAGALATGGKGRSDSVHNTPSRKLGGDGAAAAGDRGGNVPAVGLAGVGAALSAHLSFTNGNAINGGASSAHLGGGGGASAAGGSSSGDSIQLSRYFIDLSDLKPIEFRHCESDCDPNRTRDRIVAAYNRSVDLATQGNACYDKQFMVASVAGCMTAAAAAPAPLPASAAATNHHHHHHHSHPLPPLSSLGSTHRGSGTVGGEGAAANANSSNNGAMMMTGRSSLYANASARGSTTSLAGLDERAGANSVTPPTSYQQPQRGGGGFPSSASFAASLRGGGADADTNGNPINAIEGGGGAAGAIEGSPAPIAGDRADTELCGFVGRSLVAGGSTDNMSRPASFAQVANTSSSSAAGATMSAHRQTVHSVPVTHRTVSPTTPLDVYTAANEDGAGLGVSNPNNGSSGGQNNNNSSAFGASSSCSTTIFPSPSPTATAVGSAGGGGGGVGSIDAIVGDSQFRQNSIDVFGTSGSATTYGRPTPSGSSTLPSHRQSTQMARGGTSFYRNNSNAVPPLSPTTTNPSGYAGGGGALAPPPPLSSLLAGPSLADFLDKPNVGIRTMLNIDDTVPLANAPTTTATATPTTTHSAGPHGSSNHHHSQNPHAAAALYKAHQMAKTTAANGGGGGATNNNNSAPNNFKVLPTFGYTSRTHCCDHMETWRRLDAPDTLFYLSLRTTMLFPDALRASAEHAMERGGGIGYGADAVKALKSLHPTHTSNSGCNSNAGSGPGTPTTGRPHASMPSGTSSPTTSSPHTLASARKNANAAGGGRGASSASSSSAAKGGKGAHTNPLSLSSEPVAAAAAPLPHYGSTIGAEDAWCNHTATASPSSLQRDAYTANTRAVPMFCHFRHTPSAAKYFRGDDGERQQWLKRSASR